MDNACSKQQCLLLAHGTRRHGAIFCALDMTVEIAVSIVVDDAAGGNASARCPSMKIHNTIKPGCPQLTAHSAHKRGP